MNIVFGAEYENKITKEKFFLVGLTTSGVLLQGQDELKKLPGESFFVDYIETGFHDHVNYCCEVHEIHTMPHQGCLLR